MARLGIDMLTDKSDGEATATVRIRAGIQTASLSDMARAASRIFSQALTFVSMWAGSDQAATVQLSTDYTTAGINPQEMAALMSGVVTGTIPRVDFVKRMKKIGIFEADRSDDEILADMDLANEQNVGTL